MEKVKCRWCLCEFDSKDNRFDDSCPVCPKCDDQNKADMDLMGDMKPDAY